MGKKKKQRSEEQTEENVATLSDTMPGQNGHSDGPREVELEDGDRQAFFDIFRRLRDRQGTVANIDRRLKALDDDYRQKRQQLEQAHDEHLNALDEIDAEKQQRFQVIERYYGIQDVDSPYVFDEETGNFIRQDVYQERSRFPQAESDE